MKRTITLFLLLISTLVTATTKPKLVVQLVVDQLRGDLISRYQHKFGPDGFNYLLKHSLDYQNAHHPHANTVTCAGHATIATGSYPALHGIVSNEWYDRKTKSEMNCVEDLQSSILSTVRSQKSLAGRSPRNLMASTLSDEIVLAQIGRAFAVSLKDRAAITLTGHAGKAFWFDKENGGFITSKYYYSTYPVWVTDWNNRYEAKEVTWQLSAPVANYTYAKAPGFKNRFQEFGATFPHHSGSPKSETYYKFFSMMPYADELTADFAINLLAHEKLGSANGKVDYLGISFSAVDVIGHQFGPNSLESEDNLLRLDKTLAKLLAAIDKQVGLDNTLIVLTADHGVSDSPAYLAAHHIKENHSLKIPQMREIIEQTLVKHFQLPAKALQAISLPYIYLNHEIINEHQLSIHQVSAYLAETLRQQVGIFQAYPMPLANTEHDWLSAKVDKMAFPDRSGDIYLVPPPYQALADKSEQRVAHGTPWQYDSYVPLLFVNAQFKTKHITRPVHTTDIAPTLAAILSIKSPSASVGQPLTEVIETFEKDA
ncbi:alkaline phosphatase family protein [Legionella jamestowniensis]|uniref:Alkaline phosphatase n=1 Tax=Legionella jamestowniensis TaxID=455 RepID=A0A0W0ULV0_9GAMM|nr:alkaline phosphatase family protein [Legionella jamestowniensis]KTD08614.1 alkaline phosphatase [Legionella jamestowniensis]OCH96939.1 alkaline phosphatase [Legionella jamestowniensis]SFL53615.1 Type I phosphodiesterase / nucleotide pyrophosphatase [Legionella jamestowniensis DSM 19215]